MTVAEVFNEASLLPHGPVRWKTQISESSGGVYVVALVGEANLGFQLYADYLETLELQRWLPNEPVVYIGCTRCKDGLAKRVTDFYRHTYGKKSPHKGGEAVKLLRCDLWVYWSPAIDPFDSERTMINAFKERVGKLPFANRC